MLCSGENDKVLAAVERWKQAAEDGNSAELARVVEDLLQQETSYAEKNAKRFNLVLEAFQKPHFEIMVSCFDFLMYPLDAGVNRLLKRTTDLKKIHYQDLEEGATLSDLKEKSSNFFFKFVDGSFGLGIIEDYVNQMQSKRIAELCGTCADPGIVQTCFELVVFAMSDTWLRCCLPAQAFPHRMFSLAKCDEDTFLQRWKDFRETLQSCPECVDVGFSAQLLQRFDLCSGTLSEQEVTAFVKELLAKTL